MPSAPASHLHFGADTLGDLVSELVGGGVGLGQQERIRQRAVLGLHDLEAGRRERGMREGKDGATLG